MGNPTLNNRPALANLQRNSTKAEECGVYRLEENSMAIASIVKFVKKLKWQQLLSSRPSKILSSVCHAIIPFKPDSDVPGACTSSVEVLCAPMSETKFALELR